MVMGLDDFIHCAFHVLCFNVLHDCMNYIHGKVYMQKWNTRVITHNFGGLGKKMNRIVRDIEVY